MTGALTAAVETFLDPGGYLAIATNEQLRGIIDRQLIAVHASARALTARYGAGVARHPGYKAALIEAAVTTNAALAAHTLQQELPGRAAETLKTVYGVFLLETHRVWTPAEGGATGGLAAPPADVAGFLAFGDALVRSERIAALLAD